MDEPPDIRYCCRVRGTCHDCAGRSRNDNEDGRSTCGNPYYGTEVCLYPCAWWNTSGAAYLYFQKAAKKLHKQMQEKDGFVRIFLQEHLGSLMIVKAFGKEADSLTEAESHMSEHKKARMRKNHFSNVCNIGFGAVMNGAYVFGAVYGAFGIYNGTMTYGTFMAMLQLISQIQNPFANITGYLPKYFAMLASAES